MGCAPASGLKIFGDSTSVPTAAAPKTAATRACLEMPNFFISLSKSLKLRRLADHSLDKHVTGNVVIKCQLGGFGRRFYRSHVPARLKCLVDRAFIRDFHHPGALGSVQIAFFMLVFSLEA